MKDCPNLIVIKNGFTQTAKCSVDNDACYFVRICGIKSTLISSAKSINCIKRKK